MQLIGHISLGLREKAAKQSDCDPPGCGCCTSRSSAPDVHPGPGRAAEEVLPGGSRHDLEIAFQGGMVPTAIDHHALLRLVLHLLKRKRIADHIAGQLAAPLRIVGTNTDCVINRKS